MASPETAQAQALDVFLSEVRAVPWGTLAKTELDFLIFRLLVDRGDLVLSATDAALAAQLLTTPARVRALRFRYEQRKYQHLSVEQIIAAIVPHQVKGERDILVRVDSVFILDRLIDELHSRHYLVRRELTRSLIRVNVVDLFVTLSEMGALENPAGIDLHAELNDIFSSQEADERKASVKEALSKGSALSGMLRFAMDVLDMIGAPLTP
jgi:hypothetical protein